MFTQIARLHRFVHFCFPLTAVIFAHTTMSCTWLQPQLKKYKQISAAFFQPFDVATGNVCVFHILNDAIPDANITLINARHHNVWCHWPMGAQTTIRGLP